MASMTIGRLCVRKMFIGQIQTNLLILQKFLFIRVKSELTTILANPIVLLIIFS